MQRKIIISTVVRNNLVHKLYRETRNSLGNLKNVVSKAYIYGLIQAKTRLSTRTISHILNHTKEQDIDSLEFK